MSEPQQRVVLIADAWELETMNTLDCDPAGDFYSEFPQPDGGTVDLGPFDPDDE